MDDNLYILKSDVEDRDYFEDIVGLNNCVIVQEDDFYYILEGSPEDIESFCQDWSKREEF